MIQNISFMPNRANSPASALSKAAIYSHPEDVANDPKLTLAEKWEILASWILDARSVENAPAWRRLFSGAVVKVDDILRVLVSLDKQTISPGFDWPRPAPRRRSAVLKWLGRATPLRRSNDNDDDPPPAPAGLAVPFQPASVVADGSPAQRSRRLACATG